ncbi:MAG: hypothetical protein JXR88_07970 [Clostridia bacterium]|nr:hypothetical protein [Clostridia bacterium]
MSKIMMTKKSFEKSKQKDDPMENKQGTPIMGIIAIMIIATSAMAWISLISIKTKGGRLPWEA